jgi:glycine cleavage system H protein
MRRDEKQKIHCKKDISRVAKYSRRQFLKSAAVVTVGTAISSISLTSGCKSPGVSIAATTTDGNPVTGPVSSTGSLQPGTSIVQQPSSLPASTSATTAAGTPPITGYSYIPPAIPPPIIQVSGTACTIATDRLYSDNNIWVKSLSASIVVMGVTPTMVDLLAEPYGLSLSPVGTNLMNGDEFGSIEGYKLAADLMSPVSGAIIETNGYLTIPVGQGGNIAPINNDPFGIGWLIVVQLANSSQLNSLLTPEKYYTYILTL